MKGDLGSLIWIVIVVLGIAGKFLGKTGPRQPPVARTGRGGQPTMRPSAQPKPPQPANRPKPPVPANRSGSLGQLSAVQAGRPVNEPEDGEGVSLENVKATVHNWQDAMVQEEKRPEPILQPIPVQQAVVWAEILGKPAALRGPRR